MKVLQKASFGLIALLLAVFAVTPAAYAATSPSLGTAASFSVLAKSGITNVPTSTIGRDVGLSPAAAVPNMTGLTTAQVGGTIYATNSTGPAGAAGNNPGLLTTAVNDMTSVWSTGGTTGIDQPCTTTYAEAVHELGGSNLGPGVYCGTAFALTGNLTLSGSGVWIFKSTSTLNTAVGSSVTGGDPCNVWWRLASSGTIIGSNTALIGNILALTDINFQTGATLNGRALAQTAIALDHNTITGPVCTAAATGTTTTAPTPGLPNTGLAAQHSDNASWLVVGAGVTTTAFVAYLLRKKYSQAA